MIHGQRTHLTSGPMSLRNCPYPTLGDSTANPTPFSREVVLLNSWNLNPEPETLNLKTLTQEPEGTSLSPEPHTLNLETETLYFLNLNPNP